MNDLQIWYVYGDYYIQRNEGILKENKLEYIDLERFVFYCSLQSTTTGKELCNLIWEYNLVLKWG